MSSESQESPALVSNLAWRTWELVYRAVREVRRVREEEDKREKERTREKK